MLGSDPFMTFLLALALLIGFYMAWNIGANDVANAIGTSVGSGALKLRKAVVLAAIFEFCGAYFFGSDVSKTMSHGIIHTPFFVDEPLRLAIGMIAALLATGVWLQLASYFGWPVSTTHSIVGAIGGLGIATYGPDCLNWSHLSTIASSWLISPLAGAITSYIAFSWIRRVIFFKSRPLLAIKRWAPVIAAFFGSLMSWLIVFNLVRGPMLKLLWPEITLLILSIATLIYVGICLLTPYLVPLSDEKEEDEHLDIASSKIEGAIESLKQIQSHMPKNMHGQVISRINELEGMLAQLPMSSCALKSNQIQKVEGFFGWFQCISACFMALGHGANDVSNAVGPLSVAISILYTGQMQAAAAIPQWILALGGVGIVVGLATWGWRVVETVGKKITLLTPSRGFSAEIGCASTVLICSQLGLPVSTTHVLVGCILGVGLARGIGAINLNTIRDIAVSWAITLPMGAILSMIVTLSLERLLL